MTTFTASEIASLNELFERYDHPVQFVKAEPGMRELRISWCWFMTDHWDDGGDHELSALREQLEGHSYEVTMVEVPRVDIERHGRLYEAALAQDFELRISK